MKCFFCGAEMLEGKDKCDYCNKYQHDATNNNLDNQEKKGFNIEQPTNTNKSNLFLTLIKMIILLVIIAGAAYFAYQFIKSQKPIYGTWRCSNGQLIVTIDKKTFIMDNNSNGYSEAEYIINKETEEDNVKTYILNVSSNKKLKNGQTYTDSDNTQFEAVINTESKDEMTLKNTILNNEYTCYRSE